MDKWIARAGIILLFVFLSTGGCTDQSQKADKWDFWINEALQEPRQPPRQPDTQETEHEKAPAPRAARNRDWGEEKPQEPVEGKSADVQEDRPAQEAQATEEGERVKGEKPVKETRIDRLDIPAYGTQKGKKKMPGLRPIDPSRLSMEKKPVMINVDGMPLADFIVYALGETLKVPFFMDEQVKAINMPVTLHMSDKASPAKALELSLEVLRQAGLVVGEKAGSLYVLVQDMMPTGAESVGMGRDVPYSPSRIVQVVPLQYVNTKDLVPLLNYIYKLDGKTAPDAKDPKAPAPPVKAQSPVSLDVYPGQNAVVLSGPASAVQTIISFIDMMDVPYLQQKKIALMRLTYWKPDEFIGQIRKILEGLHFAVAGSPQEPGILFIPIPFLNSVVVVAPDETSMRIATQWTNRLDTVESAGNEERTFTYTPKFSKASEIVESLVSLYGLSTGAAGRPGAAQQQVAGQAPVPGTPTPAGQQPVPGTPAGLGQQGGLQQGLRNAAAGATTALGDPIKSGSFLPTETKATLPKPMGLGVVGISDDLRVAADERRNVVMIVSTPSKYRQILGLLQEIDTPPKQVLLEAVVAEVTVGENSTFGLAWWLQNKISGGLNYLTQTANPAINPLVPNIGTGLTYQFIADNQKINILLNFLATEKKLELLSKPSLMVLNNENAILQVGDEVPMVTSEVSRADITNSIDRNIQYRTSGVILKIKPTINAEGLVTLNILQEVSFPQTTTTSKIDSPTFRKRRIDTSVIAANGQTVVLGGLMLRQNDQSETKVPFLGDIPILGYAFKQESTSKQRTELIVLITPRILSNVEETTTVTKELRKSFHSFGKP